MDCYATLPSDNPVVPPPNAVLEAYRLSITQARSAGVVSLDGHNVQTAYLLQDWLKTLGGRYVGDLPDREVADTFYEVSLESWNGQDPGSTWLRIRVHHTWRVPKRFSRPPTQFGGHRSHSHVYSSRWLRP